MKKDTDTKGLGKFGRSVAFIALTLVSGFLGSFYLDSGNRYSDRARECSATMGDYFEEVVAIVYALESRPSRSLPRESPEWSQFRKARNRISNACDRSAKYINSDDYLYVTSEGFYGLWTYTKGLPTEPIYVVDDSVAQIGLKMESTLTEIVKSANSVSNESPPKRIFTTAQRAVAWVGGLFG